MNPPYRKTAERAVGNAILLIVRGELRVGNAILQNRIKWSSHEENPRQSQSSNPVEIMEVVSGIAQSSSEEGKSKGREGSQEWKEMG